MNLKQLDKATRILSEIKELDNQIISIEKHAMLIANGNVALDLKLFILDLEKQAKEQNKVGFTEDGSLSYDAELRNLMKGYFMPSFGILGSKPEEKKKECETTFMSELSESAALQILGILLYEKQTKRQSLLAKLNKIGVEA